MRRGRHRVVRAGPRAEQAHRGQHQPAEDDAEHRGEHRLAQRQPEQHREGAQDDGGEGVRAAELDAQQVQRARRALGVGDGVDAVLFDLQRAGAPGRVCAAGHRGSPRSGVTGATERYRKAAVALKATKVHRRRNEDTCASPGWSTSPSRWTPGTQVFPGDPAVRARARTPRWPPTATTCRRVAMGSQTGTHVDAPVPLRPRRAAGRPARPHPADRAGGRRRRAGSGAAQPADLGRPGRRDDRPRLHRAAAHRLVGALRHARPTSTTRSWTPTPAVGCWTPGCAPSAWTPPTSTSPRPTTTRARATRCTTWSPPSTG